MNNRNSLVFLELNSIPLDDLPEEYRKLFETYQQLKISDEKYKQVIYELERNLKTAKAGESHLSQELELISSTQNTEIDEIESKYHQQLDELKRKLSDKEDCNNSLEQNVVDLNNEIIELKEKLVEMSKNLENTVTTPASSGDRELVLEKENLQLLSKLDDFQDNIQKSLMVIADRERQIEILKEQLLCLEENLLSKRKELEEKIILLESAQERMTEVNSELAVLKSAPENYNIKGNSLFAEVDDQRKVMKQILATQKKNYLQMQKVYNESQHEIRRLKRENAAMHNELQTCSSIFLNADKTYKEKLNERIYQLLKQNDVLQEKLKSTEDQLISLGIEKGINWLDSMLAYCKNQTQQLKDELHTCRMEKCLLDLNYQNSQQEYAKWRFEALKSRCIIIDRESLLDENGIKYKQFISTYFEFSEKELNSASPQISYGKRRSLLEHLDDKTKNSNNNSIEFESNTQENLKNTSINIKSKENSISEASISPQKFSNMKSKLEHPSDEKSNISGNNLFEICEDTTTFMPSSTSTITKTMSTGINTELGQHIFEKSEYKNNILMPINNNETNENKYCTIISKDLCINSSKLNNSFEIYEDTTKNCLPFVNAGKIDKNVKEVITKNENDENLNKNEETLKKEIYDIKQTNLNSLQSGEKIEKMNNCFEIYEDTTQNCVSLGKSSCIENSVKVTKKEYFQNKNKLKIKEFAKLKIDTINKINSNDENVNLMDSKKTIEPILVKEKDVLADNFKYVKFDEKTIKKDDKSAVKVTTKRTKSNIVIRKIVFKSNSEKK